MANLEELAEWAEGIRQFEKDDVVEGGPDGIDNIPLRQLADRTRWLKQAVEGVANDLDNDFAAHVAEENPHSQYAPLNSPFFTGIPQAPTPDQRDSTTKIATTAFVGRALGNLAGASYCTSTKTLTANDIGKAVFCAGTFSLTLPAANTASNGQGFYIQSQTGIITISRAGEDLITCGSISSTTSITLGSGDWVYIISNGGARWQIVAGTPLMNVSQQSGVFASSLSRDGWQKLPGGLIRQWGHIGVPVGALQMVNFTIPFPWDVFNIQLTAAVTSGNGANTPFGAVESSSLTNFQVKNYYSGSGMNFYWEAIGN